MIHVPVHKCKISTSTMQIGMNVVLLGSGGSLSIVKKPDRLGRRWNGRKPNRMVCVTGFIDMFVHAIMEKIVPITPVRV